MKMKNLFKDKGRVITAAVTVLILLAAAFWGYMTISRIAGNPLPTVFGWGNATVLSGSMEPTLPVGSLLIIQKQDNYTPGDIVIYQDDDGSLITHRLVSLTGSKAVTKGDANNTEDTPFSPTQIKGKVQAVLPGVGSFLYWLRTPPGICSVLLALGILIFLPGYLIRKVGKAHDRV